MSFFVEMKTYNRQGQAVTVRIAPEEDSRDGAELLAWEIYASGQISTCNQHQDNIPTFQREYRFFNDYTDCMVCVVVKEYGKLAQVREGVFVL